MIHVGTSNLRERVISFGDVAVIFDDNGIRVWDFTQQRNTHSASWDQQLSLGRKATVGAITSDLNTIDGTGFFVGWNNPKGAPANVSGAHWHVIQSQFDSDWKMQLATSLGGGEIYMRIKNNSAWQGWRVIQLSLDHMKELETNSGGNSVAFGWTEDSKLEVYVNSQRVHVVRPNWGSLTQAFQTNTSVSFQQSHDFAPGIRICISPFSALKKVTSLTS